MFLSWVVLLSPVQFPVTAAQIDVRPLPGFPESFRNYKVIFIVIMKPAFSKLEICLHYLFMMLMSLEKLRL